MTFSKLLTKELLQDLYINQNMSAPEIQAYLRRDSDVEITRQYIHQLIKKYFSTRTHAKSMNIRVVKGRVDYKKVSSKIDYKNRKIDYEEIKIKRSINYNGPLKNPRTKQVSLPQPYVDRIRKYAKDNNMTITDVLRSVFEPLGYSYPKYILREVKQSFKSYSYDKKQLTDLLDKYFRRGGSTRNGGPL